MAAPPASALRLTYSMPASMPAPLAPNATRARSQPASGPEPGRDPPHAGSRAPRANELSANASALQAALTGRAEDEAAGERRQL